MGWGWGGFSRLPLYQPAPPGEGPTIVPMGTSDVAAATSSFTGEKLTICRDVFQIFSFLAFLFFFFVDSSTFIVFGRQSEGRLGTG